MDIATVVRKYRDLQRALPGATIYYAVKANPLPDVIRALAAAGSSFDVASEEEIRDCLALGVPPSRCSFGHTIKKAAVVQSHAMRGADLGATYIVVLGLEAAFAFGLGAVLFAEAVTATKVAAVLLIVAGIALLRAR